MSADFHLDRLPIIVETPYGGGCGCGCGGSGGCGEYSGLVDWPNYRNVNNEMYASCPDYTRAVDAFTAFRAKATGLYGEYPRADVWLGGKGKTSNAKEPKLRSEREALRELRNLERQAKLALQKCKGAAKSGGALPDAELEKSQVSNTTTDSGGGSGDLMLYAGMGMAALLGVGMLVVAMRRKKAE